MTREQWDELFLKVDTMPLDELEKIIVDSARKAGVLQTNADRIRAMSDEELAKTMHDMTLISTEIGLSTEWWEQWLKSPVEEVDNG